MISEMRGALRHACTLVMQKGYERLDDSIIDKIWDKASQVICLHIHMACSRELTLDHLQMLRGVPCGLGLT